MKKQIHISVIANDEGTHVSFYFGGATVENLSMLNHELDILKIEILDRLKDSPKDYEVQDFGDRDPPDMEV